MSLINFQFYSTELKQSTAVNIILPTAFLGAAFAEPPYAPPSADNKFRAVYLLHGITGDHAEWHKGSQIEYTALQHRAAVVTPDVGNSFGKNLISGANFENYLALELPALLESHFPLSPKRGDKAIAGLSMGGYAALRTAFAHPEVFGFAASLSGAVDVLGLRDENNPLTRLARPLAEFAFGAEGERFDKDYDDLLASLLRLRELGSEIPKIYQAVGKSDFLRKENVKLHNALQLHGFDAVYEEGAGAHDYAFWNEYAGRMLKWFMGFSA
ncbi:esterase [Clostridia bacterium]|nr:esterase [Clostridia bacterium]